MKPERTTLESMTLINAYNEKYRIWIVFICTGIYSIMGHSMIHMFETKRKQLKDKEVTEACEMTELEISLHTVMIKGINRSVAQSEAQYEVNELFSDIFGRILI